MERTTEEIQRDIGKMIDQITANANLIADALIDICKQSKPENHSEDKATADYRAYAETKQNEAKLGDKSNGKIKSLSEIS